MIAYNRISLDNLHVRTQAAGALDSGFITAAEEKAVREAYPVRFWSPNFWIRTGVFCCSIMVMFMAFGFIFAMVASSAGYGVMFGIFSFIIYAALEFVVREKHHYRSGLDDASLWVSAGLFVTSVNLIAPYLSPLAESIMIFAVAAWLTLRFANVLISTICFFAFLAMIFYAVLPFGTAAKAIMPFLIMVVSIMISRLTVKGARMQQLRHYFRCLTWVRIAALVTIYSSVNFFVVREASDQMFGLHLQPGQSIPFGWLFWSATIGIPPVYIILGVRRKDSILLRCGLLLMAASVATMRYYHPVFPIEISLTVAGIVMIGAAYSVGVYLRKPRYGVTDKIPNDPRLPLAAQLEALAIAQAFHPMGASATSAPAEFGGGTGGGGGATGTY